GMLVGLVLVAIGVMVAGNRLLPHGFRFDHFGAPLLLIGGGLAILVLRRRDDEDDHHDEEEDDEPGFEAEAPTLTTTEPPTEPPTGPAESAARMSAPNDADTTAETPTAPLVGTAPVPPSAWTQNAPWPAPPTARASRRS